MNNKLLPCPFCLKESTPYISEKDQFYKIKCNSCGCKSGSYKSLEHVIELWNARREQKSEVSKWISVKDRLPPPDDVDATSKYVFISYNTICKECGRKSQHKEKPISGVGYYSCGDDEWYLQEPFSDIGEYIMEDVNSIEVTHWMPIPEKDEHD